MKGQHQQNGKKFYNDMERILDMTLTGPTEKKLEIMTRIIYTMAEDIFGVEPPPQKKRTVYRPSRRKREIKNIRKELRTLANKYR